MINGRWQGEMGGRSMKILTLMVIVALLFSSCAHIPDGIKPDLHPRPWTKEEKILLAVSIVAAGADYYTTERCLDRGHREMNPLIGKHPTDTELTLKASAGYFMFLLIAHYCPKLRPYLLGGQAFVNACFAAHNSTVK
jgi:hypothetical protein